VAWTDLYIAPAAQPDRTQIVLVCAHTLARTEGVGGRAERRVRERVATATRPRTVIGIRADA
jgi:hypothetical protein